MYEADSGVYTNVPILGSMLELDPLNLCSKTPGAKLDKGKNRLGLVLGGFSKALEEVGHVGTFGANKYSDNGWMSVPNGLARYEDALLRHTLASKREALDPESGLPHLAHRAWNALAVLELHLREKESEQTNLKSLGKALGY